jgi:hypothetical protein
MDTSYMLVIRCPNTGQEVGTGLSMSKEAFKHPAIKHSAINHCAACGKYHEWAISDARLKLEA